METRLQLVQRLDAVTGSAGGVYLSLWASPDEPYLYEHYSTDFTGDPAYPSLAVNGGFDPVVYGPQTPADQRYTFSELKARIAGVN